MSFDDEIIILVIYLNFVYIVILLLPFLQSLQNSKTLLIHEKVHGYDGRAHDLDPRVRSCP